MRIDHQLLLHAIFNVRYSRSCVPHWVSACLDLADLEQPALLKVHAGFRLAGSPWAKLANHPATSAESSYQFPCSTPQWTRLTSTLASRAVS